MTEGGKARGRRLDLDWDALLGEDREPPPIVVISTTVDDDSPPQPSPRVGHSPMSDEPEPSYRTQILEGLTDRELDEHIHRKRVTMEVCQKLPDQGLKLKLALRRYLEEKERRCHRKKSGTNGCRSLMKIDNSTTVGESDDDFKHGNQSSKVQKSFGDFFIRKLDENQTDCRDVKAFDKEISFLGHSHRRNINGECSQKVRQEARSFPVKSSFKGPQSLSVDRKSNIPRVSNQKGGASSLGYCEKSLASCLAMKRNASEIFSSRSSRRHKAQTVVLVDEEEEQATEATEQAENLPESMKGTTIYYPSRDDIEAVEICYKDIMCLDPKAYLSSSIMNFYIRYLQQLESANDREHYDYQFFNTYFYNKISERSDEGSFLKVRRWWKGVNIFQKAYIFIPIHENLHWSLVIICIPDIEDESGPIILHLDSLRLHSSKSIFKNIKRFLSDEWNFLNKEDAARNIPIADRVWKHLPRRIDEKILMVPQQKNDYDCGLFVLYFMKRFIDEAPDRLRKNDLAMFGKQWFRPEEASGLRWTIKKLLIQEFKSSSDEYSCISEPMPSPLGAISV